MNTSPLFTPFPFGRTTLKSRIVMAPMTRSQSPGGVPTDQVAVYYERRAEADVGLIVTEGTTVAHPAANGYPRVPRFYGDDALAGWRRVVDRVHAAGGAVIPQLWHVGSVRERGMEPDPAIPGVGPSAVLHPYKQGKGDLPQTLRDSDISDIIAAFGQAAAAARRLGFDGVELHGAHGYLIDQFFWATTNRRVDRWGGSPEARGRFAAAIITEVRRALGPELALVFRWSQWKMGDYRARLASSPDALARFLSPLVDAGVDIFHCSQRRFWEPEFDGSDLNLAGWVKKLTGKPTITVGSVALDMDFIGSFGGASSRAAGLDELLRRLDRGDFDLVAVGRALLADPAWAAKIRSGRESEVEVFQRSHLARLT